MASNRRIFKFRIFGWFLLLSRTHAKIVVSEQSRKCRWRMRELRRKHYRQTNGCCEHCGRHLSEKEFQMHHVFQYSKFPKWARKSWNVLMLCPRCHYMYHNNIVLQVRTMERIALQQGIDMNCVCQDLS